MMRHGKRRVGGLDTADAEDTEVAAPRTEAALRDRRHTGGGLRSEGHRGEARRLRWSPSQGAREEGVGRDRAADLGTMSGIPGDNEGPD